MAYELSVIIPARQEEWLARTVQEVVTNSTDATECIVVLDGAPANPPLEPHPRLTVVQHPASIGQRAACNEAARISRARYMMKLDAHCALDKEFDVKLMAQCEPDWTVVPRLYNLHVFDWVCTRCNHRTYQGPEPQQCPKCKQPSTFTRDIVWRPKSTKSDFMRFDSNLEFKYWGSFGNRPEAQGDIAPTMSLLGACWFLERRRYWELGGSDERYGSWGQQGTEIACKAWLSGGQLVVNKTTWYSHLFRTQSGFNFPYPNAGKAAAMARCHELWFNNKWEHQTRPLSWLLEHFAPVPDWHDIFQREKSWTEQQYEAHIKQAKAQLQRVMAAGDQFYRDRRQPIPPRRVIKKTADTQLTVGVVLLSPRLPGKRFLGRLNGHKWTHVSSSELPETIQLTGTDTDRALAGLNELDTDIAIVTAGGSPLNFRPPTQSDIYKIPDGLCAYRDTLIQYYRGQTTRIVDTTTTHS